MGSTQHKKIMVARQSDVAMEAIDEMLQVLADKVHKDRNLLFC